MKQAAYTHNMDSDLVSIIVPVYNCEQYLRECVQSIINQSHTNIEVILVDDGSTDSSGQLCDEYAGQDNRIQVIHAQNGGPAAARNIGIEKSTGGFMFFADADDFLEEDALAILLQKYKDTSVDLVIGEFNRVKNGHSDYGDNGIFTQSGLLTKQEVVNYTRRYLKKPNRFPLFAYSWAKLFKADIIKNNNLVFNPNLRTFEDVAFNFDYLPHADNIYLLKKVVYNHLVHENFLSATMKISQNPISLFGYREAIAVIGNFLEHANAGTDAQKDLGHAYISLTIIQLVRTCGQINSNNQQTIYRLISEITNYPALRNNLPFYTPTGGESKILPILMKLKLVWPIVWVCKYKAYKRYGKGRAGK